MYSMTAFANTVAQHESGILTWELRSVNHRYLELNIRLPETLRSLEPEIREKLRQQLQRGKVDCVLTYQSHPTTAGGCHVNAEWVKQLAQAADQVRQLWPHLASPNVLAVLNWPGVLQTKEETSDSVPAAALAVFDKAVKIFTNKRQTEGHALQSYLEERLNDFMQRFSEIKQRLPQLIKEQRQKLFLRFAELKPEVAAERFAQEVTILLQKVDVAEELSRIEMHTQELKNTVQQGGVIGKRLDFLLQELNRETNTLSAKSFDGQAALAAIELKVLIEQMREQVQNIE